MKKWNLGIVLGVSVISVLLMWLPFLFKTNRFWGIEFGQKTMQTIVSNFDGINFLIVAKTMYDPRLIEVNFPSILSGRENLYFSAHFPGFPLVIKAFDTFLSGPNALLAAILFSNLLLAIALYMFFRLFTKSTQLCTLLAVAALFIPGRMLSMRIVGSNETLFIFFVLMSLIAAMREKHFLAGLLGAFAVLTRSPGILLFFAYMIEPIFSWIKTGKLAMAKIAPYFLIPLSLIGLWAAYGLIFGDYLAYFKVGGNINLYFPPFQVFGTNFPWVDGMWREDIIYLYLFYVIGIAKLWSLLKTSYPQYLTVAYFGSIYLLMLFFIVHRDLARYALPIAPLAIAGYSSYFENKYAKIILIILLVPITLYSWNFILNNVQPVMDWSAYL